MKTTIEWTEETWNPTTGCDKVSAGCKFCYAERLSEELQRKGSPKYANGFKLTLHPHTLDLPRRAAKPTVYFVNSMSDLFHEDIPLEFLQKVFKVMNETPQHTYQILTKRTDVLLSIHEKLTWTRNIWIGASVEDEQVTNRIAPLFQISGCGIRFLSLEPLIGPLDNLDLSEINWVIVGGESGPNARPMKKEWVESILRQCDQWEIPFFFKQWGKPEFNPNRHDPTILKYHPLHAKGGCQLNGIAYKSIPILIDVEPRTGPSEGLPF